MTLIAIPHSDLGLDFEAVDVVVYVRGGSDVVRGDLVAFFTHDAEHGVDGAITPTNEEGGPLSVFSNVVSDYDDATAKDGLFGVALENIPINGRGRVRVSGIVKANVMKSNNGAIAIGHGLVASIIAGKKAHLDAAYVVQSGATTTVTRKIFGMNLEAFSTAPTSGGTQMMVLFDGINGFGGINSA